MFDASLTELLNTDTLVFNQNVKNKNNTVNTENGYIINHLSEKLIDQYEARIAEKEAALTKQESMINELREQLKKESRIP